MEIKHFVIYLVLVSVLSSAEIGKSKKKDYRNVMEDVVKQRKKRESPVSHDTINPVAIKSDPTKFRTGLQNPHRIPVIVPANRKFIINANELPIDLKSANKAIPTNAHLVRMALLDQEKNKLHKINGNFNGRFTVGKENDKPEVLKTGEASEVLSELNLNHEKDNNKQHKAKQQEPKQKPKLFYEEEPETINSSKRTLSKPLGCVSSKNKGPNLEKQLQSPNKPPEVTRIVNATHVIDITKLPSRRAKSDIVEAKTESRPETARKLTPINDCNSPKPAAKTNKAVAKETKAPLTLNSRKIEEVKLETNKTQLDNDDSNQDCAVSELADSVLIRRYNEFEEKGTNNDFPRDAQNDVLVSCDYPNDQPTYKDYENDGNVYNMDDGNNIMANEAFTYEKSPNIMFENVNYEDPKNSQAYTFNHITNLQNSINKIWRTWEDIEIKFNKNKLNKYIINGSPGIYDNNNPWVSPKSAKCNNYPYIFQNQ